MHERLGNRAKKRSTLRENIVLLFGVCATLVAAILMDGRGMPQKWHAAIFGTALPFCFVVAIYPSSWLKRWSFWASIAICLGIHLIGIWVFFRYFLGKNQQLGWALWLPVAAVEAIVLVVAVKKTEEKVTGKSEILDLG